ncbi:hypothetical protein HA402_001368 [Bradysia odoriphaga]|nr:hypothetical protein HA402_001368 [Bradysia odoriphaga]
MRRYRWELYQRKLASGGGGWHEEVDDVLDDLLHDLNTITMFQYSIVPKNLSWYESTHDAQRFRRLIRCTRSQFEIILNLISDHECFNGPNSDKQFTVAFQLALTLYRLGSNGDGSTILKISRLFGVGNGGTIDRVTQRVFKAILSVEQTYLTWPSAEERLNIVDETMNELPHCILYTDGCEVELADRPSLNGDVYLSKSKVYSVKLQGTCDYKKRLRQINIGYPGSVHDSRIFSNCPIATNPTAYITEPQWIAADSAYKLSSTVITPFRKNSNQLTEKDRKDFNQYFSTYRVRIEHVFGLMKEKFPSLKKLSIRIRDAKSHEFVCTWIRVCCILHNVLLPHFDEEDLTCINNGFRSNHEEEEFDGCEDSNEDKDGQMKRIALFQVLNEPM